MRPERYAYSYAGSGPRRSLKARLWFALLVLLALALLAMTRFEAPAVARLRTQLDAALAPLVQLVNMPLRGTQAFVAQKKALVQAHEKNQELMVENDALRRWQAVAQALKVENDALRALAGYHPSASASYVTAQVIAQSPSAYAGTLMIDAGSAEGLAALQPVVDSYGLIGRVIDVGEHTARVLLLTDSSSHVPVISGNSRQHAILAGTGGALLRMTFVGGDSQTISLGEPVMTTAEGGLIPESVMVGTVFRRDSSGLMVKPLRPLTQAEYVRVMLAKH
ncbi:MAG: rod shape-determining protein MreC [Alphaproteobacteria bacterium]|nr:rod shape-determining protein MreC [Alphaproteobacteria bacterium]